MSATDDTPSISPGEASGPSRNPATISAAASAKLTTTWKECAPSASTWPVFSPGKVQSAPAATAVSASQRHMRKRASAKAAAVTTAR
jgi:hypothetical protein